MEARPTEGARRQPLHEAADPAAISNADDGVDDDFSSNIDEAPF